MELRIEGAGVSSTLKPFNNPPQSSRKARAKKKVGQRNIRLLRFLARVMKLSLRMIVSLGLFVGCGFARARQPEWVLICQDFTFSGLLEFLQELSFVLAAMTILWFLNKTMKVKTKRHDARKMDKQKKEAHEVDRRRSQIEKSKKSNTRASNLRSAGPRVSRLGAITGAAYRGVFGHTDEFVKPGLPKNTFLHKIEDEEEVEEEVQVYKDEDLDLDTAESEVADVGE